MIGRRQRPIILLIFCLGLFAFIIYRSISSSGSEAEVSTDPDAYVARDPRIVRDAGAAETDNSDLRSIGDSSVLYFDKKHHHVINGRVFLNDDPFTTGFSPKQRSDLGFDHMRQLRVAIAGTARNCLRILKLMRPRFEAVARKFADFQFFFVENDSKDDTRQFLLNWGREPAWAGKIEVLGCGGVNLTHCHEDFASGQHVPGGKNENSNFNRRRRRVAIMAQLRNLYLNRILSAPDRGQKPFDLIMVVDFDLLATFSEKGIARAVLHFKNGAPRTFVDAVCSNARGASLSYFWDACTVVFPPMSKYDPFEQPWELVVYKSVISAAIPRQPGLWRPQKVLSCFQGFAIYRTESVKKYAARYTGPPAGYQTCEHNMFAYQLKNLYIEPSFDVHVTVNGSE